jgi:hypothetical protein
VTDAAGRARWQSARARPRRASPPSDRMCESPDSGDITRSSRRGGALVSHWLSAWSPSRSADEAPAPDLVDGTLSACRTRSPSGSRVIGSSTVHTRESVGSSAMRAGLAGISACRGRRLSSGGSADLAGAPSLVATLASIVVSVRRSTRARRGPRATRRSGCAGCRAARRRCAARRPRTAPPNGSRRRSSQLRYQARAF